MNRTCPKTLRNRKRRIARRLAPRNWTDQPVPIMGASTIRCELSARTQPMS